MRDWPVALIDQYEAAAAEAKAGFRASPGEVCDFGEAACRIALHWSDSIAVPSSIHCGHLKSPAPMFGHANLPGQVWCTTCTEIAPEPPWCCSICRAEADFLQEGELLLGAARITYLLCRACDA
jgi:hypothetical protein